MTSSPLKAPIWYGLLPILILILDQSSKLWVYYNMVIGPAGEIRIFGDFFKLHYLTNPGMAFGLDIGGMYGKFALTFMRILVIGAIGYYFYKILLKGQRKGLIVAIASIFGGGMGNVIDSIFMAHGSVSQQTVPRRLGFMDGSLTCFMWTFGRGSSLRTSLF